VQKSIDLRRSELEELRIDSRSERLRQRIRPDKLLNVEIDQLAGLKQRLRLAIDRRLEIAQQEQLRLRERSKALDPSLVLRRGYALVRRENQQVVRDSGDLVVGEELRIQFGKGKTIKVRVIDDSEE
jgi:exodeoxyribonuclease VII large subunit